MTTRSRHQPVLSAAEFQERLAASLERHASTTSPKLSLPLTLVEPPPAAERDDLRAQIMAKFPPRAFTAHRENIADSVMPFVDELHTRLKGMAFAAAMLSRQVQALETELHRDGAE
jgi:hypothetical protein